MYLCFYLLRFLCLYLNLHLLLWLFSLDRGESIEFLKQAFFVFFSPDRRESIRCLQQTVFLGVFFKGDFCLQTGERVSGVGAISCGGCEPVVSDVTKQGNDF